MKPIQHILFPTDFSPCADQALDHCLQLAAGFGAAVTLLHVQVLHDGTDESDAEDMATLLRRAGERASDILDERARRSADTVRVESGIVRGFSAAEEILARARNGGHDLIVMGTHGRGWMERVLLGSAAAQVIRLSRVPVYTVREGARPIPDDGRFGRLVVPMDFSDGSREALRVGGEIASRHFAVLDTVHVVEKHDCPSFYPDRQPDAGEAGLDERCREHMEREVAGVCPPGLRLEYHVLEGRPGREIVRHAEKSGAGLVVIAGQGLGGRGWHLLGSTVENVVAASPTAVLTIKRGDTNAGD